MSDENSLIAVIENVFVGIEECENFTMNFVVDIVVPSKASK